MGKHLASIQEALGLNPSTTQEKTKIISDKYRITECDNWHCINKNITWVPQAKTKNDSDLNKVDSQAAVWVKAALGCMDIPRSHILGNQRVQAVWTVVTLLILLSPLFYRKGMQSIENISNLHT